MFARRDKIILIIVCLILGFVIARQFYLQKQVTQVSEPEAGNSIALEVTELIKTNEKLRKEINNLNENINKLNESTSSSQKASDTIQANLEVYKVVLATTDIIGPGVEILFSERADYTQLIDLVNALKNIGSEAISVNNKRIGPFTSIEEGIFYPPTTVSAIGNPDVLKDSLIRPGGIIDQIGAGKVEKKETISLKSI